MRRAVFLDRDGVVNRPVIRDGRSFPPATLEAFEILPGVPEAVAALRAAGFLIVVATNQPDVATGTQRREVVEAMNERVRRALAVDAIKVCYHTDADACACRKPRPGMLLEAARELDIDLGASVMVGDRWRDIAAGRAAGCRTVLVDWHYGEAMPQAPDATVDSLAAASRWILGHPAPGAAAPARAGGQRKS